jgi:capsular polysaccharide biosynthesis protein
MPFTSFGYASINDFGKVLVAEPPVYERIAGPDYVHGTLDLSQLPDWVRDPYFMTYRKCGDNEYEIRTEGRSLVRLHDVVLRKNILDRNVWALLLDETVVAAESYHSTPAIFKHIGLEQSLKLEGVGDETASVRFMETVDVERLVTIEEPRILLNHMWCDNFSHTYMETASRMWIKDFYTLTDQFLCVYNSSNTVQDEIMRSFGIKFAEQGENDVRYNTLYVPSFGSPGGFNTRSVQFLRKALMPQWIVSNEQFGGPKKIYIDRKDAKTRRVANDDELWAALEPLGFVRIELTNRPPQAQANMFVHADQIVAPHGAGLTNVIFATPGAKVCEIVGDKHPTNHPMYWMLSKMVGCEYGRVIGTTGENDDITVDVDAVIKFLEA